VLFRCLIDSREELKFCLDVVDCLVCSHLLNMPQLDAHVAQAMENGANYMAVAFAMQLLQLYLVEERRNAHVSESDLFNTIDMLARINMHARQPPEG
jgi:CCR4-NOT transcription complex subunit 1